MFADLLRGLWYGLGLGKKTKKFVDTDEEKFLKEIPDGQIFVFLTADRTPDFLQGGIQGASKSFWQHAGIGIKRGNDVEIIESLTTITKDKIQKYLHNDNQMILFFSPISKTDSIAAWNRACTKEGQIYDYIELVGHLLPDDVFKVINNPELYTCGVYSAWTLRPWYRIVKQKIDPDRCTPGDIYNCLYPKKEVAIIKYNIV